MGEIVVDRTARYSVLVSTGELTHVNAESVTAVVPAFIPQELVTRCGNTYPAANPIEHSARVEVLKRLQRLSIKLEHAVNFLTGTGPNFYKVFSSGDPEKWGTVTVKEATKLWANEPNNAIFHLATNAHLLSQSLSFRPAEDFTVSGQFEVRPQAHVDRILKVREWLNQRDSPVDAFARKAQGVLEKNAPAVIQSLRALQEPSSVPVDHTWTEDDLTLIKFILSSLTPHKSYYSDPYDLGVSTIVKKIVPGVDVDDVALQNILIGLGVVAPWQNMSLLRPDLRKVYDQETVDSNEQIATVSFAQRRSTAEIPQVMGPEDLYRSDPVEHLRHDFGDMKVYTIDDDTAQEIDDGVSIETIAGEPDHFWVHAHIADPTHILPPTHILSKRAAKRGTTVYLYDKHYPLLPNSLTTGEDGTSLVDNGRSQRVLTFSAKVDLEGRVLDYAVRPGIVNNVVKLSYDRVDAALGHPHPELLYPFGGKPPAPIFDPLSEDDMPALSLLDKVAKGFVKRRFDEGVLTHARTEAIVSFDMPDLPSPTLTPSAYHGFPDMKFSVLETYSFDAGARSMVAECMKLASRTASRWGLDHDIPLLRRHSTPPSVVSQDDWQTLLNMRTSSGYVPFHAATRYLALDSVSGYSTEPRAHWPVGIREGEGYTRASSPLRRYTDLVAHWQIYAGLLKQKPPFSATEMEVLAVSTKLQERHTKRAQGQYKTLYQNMFIRRFMEDEARREGVQNPLRGVEAYTLTQPELRSYSGGYSCTVHVPMLGVKGLLGNLKEPEKFPPGSSVRVDIVEARVGLRPLLLMELTRR